MKSLIISAVFVLLITTVKAQDTGTMEPKILTCTEMAFNFSFRIGQKFNFSQAKFGAVEAATYETDNIPAYFLKAKAVKPDEYLLPSSFRAAGFSVVDKNANLFPAFNFGPMGEYTLLAYKPLKPFVVKL